MTLPSSGTLSLNAIHIEAGGSNATSCSINDSDIRGLIGKSSGASMSFNEWYGASSFTANTQIDITSANSNIKFAKPSFSTYSSGLFTGSHGTAHDYLIQPTQGNIVYIHSTSGSTVINTVHTIGYNGSANANGGGSSSTALNGLYWRIPSGVAGSGGTNHLLGTGTATTSNSGNSNINIFLINNQNASTDALLGTTFGARVQIQIF